MDDTLSSVFLKTRTCTKCGAEFQHKSNTVRTYCPTCYSAWASERYANGIKRQPANQKRNNHYERTYGVTLAEYNQMLEAQGGVCAACGSPETKMNTRSGQVHNLLIDHNHKSGKVRELLCNNCNVTLGLMNDSPERLIALLKYLEKHEKGG